jgi:hypothetical protein
MNQEPNREREPYTFTLEFDGGEKFKCNPHNTMAYIHSQEPHGDHLFIFKLNEEGEIEWGSYVWRRRITNFDDLIMKMAYDYPIVEREILNDEDRSQYNEFITRFGEQPSEIEKPAVEPENAPEIPELDWISPRQEKEVRNAAAFLIYLAENGRL